MHLALRTWLYALGSMYFDTAQVTLCIAMLSGKTCWTKITVVSPWSPSDFARSGRSETQRHAKHAANAAQGEPNLIGRLLALPNSCASQDFCARNCNCHLAKVLHLSQRGGFWPPRGVKTPGSLFFFALSTNHTQTEFCSHAYIHHSFIQRLRTAINWLQYHRSSF